MGIFESAFPLLRFRIGALQPHRRITGEKEGIKKGKEGALIIGITISISSPGDDIYLVYFKYTPHIKSIYYIY